MSAWILFGSTEEEQLSRQKQKFITKPDFKCRCKQNQQIKIFSSQVLICRKCRGIIRN